MAKNISVTKRCLWYLSTDVFPFKSGEAWKNFDSEYYI